MKRPRPIKISPAQLRRAVDAAFGPGAFDDPDQKKRWAFRATIRAAIRAYHGQPIKEPVKS